MEKLQGKLIYGKFHVCPFHLGTDHKNVFQKFTLPNTLVKFVKKPEN